MKTLSASSIRPEPITRSLTPVGNPEYGSADVHPADHRPPSARSDKSTILVQPKGKTSKTNGFFFFFLFGKRIETTSA